MRQGLLRRIHGVGSWRHSGIEHSSTMQSTAIPMSHGFDGIIQGATLPDLIQMECLAMSTRAVRVERGSRKGRIYFAGGQVVHAKLDDLVGEPALFEMLRWTGGVFEVEEGIRSMEETITRHWQGLLLEAAQHADEKAAFSNSTPITTTSAPPPTTPKAMTAIPMIPTPPPELFRDPEVKSAVQFSEEGELLEFRSDDPETMQATFAFVTQLLRLVGNGLGAENLREVQVIAPDEKAVCVIRDTETTVMITTGKANISNLVKKFS
jgi:hypothetical protein